MAYSESLNQYFQSLGKAISSWQDLEASLFYAVHRILDTHPYYTSIIFFHIKSPDAKVKLLDSLVRECFGKGITERWKPVSKKPTNLVTERNRLAHYQTMVDVFEKDDKHHFEAKLTDPYLRFAETHMVQNPIEHDEVSMDRLSKAFRNAAKEIDDFILEKFPDASSPGKHQERDSQIQWAINRKIQNNSKVQKPAKKSSSE